VESIAKKLLHDFEHTSYISLFILGDFHQTMARFSLSKILASSSSSPDLAFEDQSFPAESANVNKTASNPAATKTEKEEESTPIVIANERLSFENVSTSKSETKKVEEEVVSPPIPIANERLSFENVFAFKQETRKVEEEEVPPPTHIVNERLSFENVTTSETVGNSSVSSHASPDKETDTFSDASSDLIVRSMSSNCSGPSDAQRNDSAHPSSELKESNDTILRARSYSELSLDPAMLSVSLLETTEQLSEDIIDRQTKNHEDQETDYKNARESSNLKGAMKTNLESPTSSVDRQLPAEAFLNVGGSLQLKAKEESKFDFGESPAKQVQRQDEGKIGDGQSGVEHHYTMDRPFQKWTRSVEGKILAVFVMSAGLWFANRFTTTQNIPTDIVTIEKKEIPTVDTVTVEDTPEIEYQLNITESCNDDSSVEKVADTINLFSPPDSDIISLDFDDIEADTEIENNSKDFEADHVLGDNDVSSESIEDPSNERENVLAVLVHHSEALVSSLSEAVHVFPDRIIEAKNVFGEKKFHSFENVVAAAINLFSSCEIDAMTLDLDSEDDTETEENYKNFEINRVADGKDLSDKSIEEPFSKEIGSSLLKSFFPDEAEEATKAFAERKLDCFEHVVGGLIFVMLLWLMLVPSGDGTIPGEEEDTDMPAQYDDSKEEYEDCHMDTESDYMSDSDYLSDSTPVPKRAPEKLMLPEKLVKYEKLRVKKDLRRLLRHRGLKVSGRKYELIIRLGEAYEKELYQKTVKDLKSLLKEKKLPVTGIKEDLVRRLVHAGFDRD